LTFVHKREEHGPFVASATRSRWNWNESPRADKMYPLPLAKLLVFLRIERIPRKIVEAKEL
jgi:hypothetical protein